LNKKHQVSQNKRTNHRTTLIRQTKTKEKKTSDNTYQANKNKRKKSIGQHLTGKPKQKN